jgi:hypothetical protein
MMPTAVISISRRIEFLLRIFRGAETFVGRLYAQPSRELYPSAGVKASIESAKMFFVTVLTEHVFFRNLGSGGAWRYESQPT